LLDSVLRRLPRPTDPNVLVGFDTNDDAGVYLLSPEMALVQTVDFFTRSWMTRIPLDKLRQPMR